MTIGQRIKQRRETLNIGQSDLARKVNISKQTLYKYENDIVTNIPSDKIQHLADALETTPSYLMGWEEFIDEVAAGSYEPAEIDKAIEMYEQYKHAMPKVQSMVDFLLTAEDPSESEVLNTPIERSLRDS